MADETEDQNALLKQLASALRESRSGTDQKLEELSKILSQIVPDIRQLQRDVLLMQADMRTRYVSREEYEPRHQILTDKIQQYDKMVAESAPARDRFVRLEEASKAHDKDIDGLRLDMAELDRRFRGIGARSLPWIGTALSLIALLLTFLSHVNFR